MNITLFKAHLDFTIQLSVLHEKSNAKLDIRIELPHLYPLLENAIVIIHSPLLSKPKEIYLKAEIENFISTMEKSETYVFQVISWIQEQIDELIKRDNSKFEKSQEELAPTLPEELVDFERLWIYSHHIKSKTKRQEIAKQARNFELSGFSRPGKPGIICIEGIRENTQEFWRILKSMRWQKIVICKSEVKHGKLEKLRRFEGFKEQLFCDDLDNEEGIMNMGLFLKYLELHNSGYMKKELFGLE